MALILRRRVRMLAPLRCLSCRVALIGGPFPTALMDEMAYRYGVCVGCQLTANPAGVPERRTPCSTM